LPSSVSLRALSSDPAFSCAIVTCSRRAKVSSTARIGRASEPALKTVSVRAGSRGEPQPSASRRRSRSGMDERYGTAVGRRKEAESRDRPRRSFIRHPSSVFRRLPRKFRRPPSRFPMTQLALEIRGANKRYAEHVAVRDLSLAVPAGTVYGLLGPNGAGKTTTIRMILNVIAPDAGTITLLGRSNRDPSTQDRIGYLPEERGLYKKMNVRDVLRFLAELKGVGRKDADRRIDEWLDRLTLRTAEKDWGKSKVDELSRGMQQKVQFIGTLLHDPELVILDEPFSGLDPI